MRVLLGLPMVVATVVVLAPRPSEARELWVCKAQGAYQSCNAAGTCTNLPVSEIGYSPEQSVAQTFAVNGCNANLDLGMTNARIWANVRRTAVCSLQRCWQEDEASVRAALGGGTPEAKPAPAPTPAPTPAAPPAGETKPASQIPACAPAIALVCEVCGAEHLACKRASTAKSTAAECRTVATGLREVKKAINVQPEIRAKLGQLCADMAKELASAP